MLCTDGARRHGVGGVTRTILVRQIDDDGVERVLRRRRGCRLRRRLEGVRGRDGRGGRSSSSSSSSRIASFSRS